MKIWRANRCAIGQRVNVNDQRLWYAADHLNSVHALLNPAGLIMEGFVYDVYGGHYVLKQALTDPVFTWQNATITTGGSSSCWKGWRHPGRTIHCHAFRVGIGLVFFEPMLEQAALSLVEEPQIQCKSKIWIAEFHKNRDKPFDPNSPTVQAEVAVCKN